MQDTINELETIIEYFEKYGDPKSSQKNTDSANKIPELEYPNKITLAWLREHVPMQMWITLFGILITAFLAGVAITETPTYKSFKHIWKQEQTEIQQK